MTIEENNIEEQNLTVGENPDVKSVESPEPPDATQTEAPSVSATDASPSSDEEQVEESGEEAPSEAEGASEETPDAFLTQLAEKLTRADSAKFEALTAKFAADESFEKGDIQWVSEVSGLAPEIVRYGLSLQREQYLAEKAADTSIADAESELGVGLKPLMDFVQGNATDAQKQEWDSAWKVAEKYNDNNLRMSILKEMKDFKDSIPGNKPKTLAHLASSQRAAEAQPVKVETAPENPNPSPVVDPLMRELERYNTQALASLAQSSTADPAVVSRARAILKTRGI